MKLKFFPIIKMFNLLLLPKQEWEKASIFKINAKNKNLN